MDFSKAKTILILLFLGVNLFLLLFLFSVSDTSITLDRTSVDNAVQILKNKGITIDPAVIPKKTEKPYVLELYNPLTDENSALVAALSEKGELSLSNQFFTFVPNTPIAVSVREGESNRKIQSTLSAALSELGFYTADLSMGSSKKQADADCYFFQKYYAGSLFFNTNLSVSVRDGGIVKIEGNYCELVNAKPIEGSFKSPLDILIAFSSSYGKKGEIQALELGYFVSDEDYKTLPAIPSWRVLTTQNERYDFDAVNSRLLATHSD